VPGRDEQLTGLEPTGCGHRGRGHPAERVQEPNPLRGGFPAPARICAHGQPPSVGGVRTEPPAAHELINHTLTVSAAPTGRETWTGSQCPRYDRIVDYCSSGRCARWASRYG